MAPDSVNGKMWRLCCQDWCWRRCARRTVLLRPRGGNACCRKGSMCPRPTRLRLRPASLPEGSAPRDMASAPRPPLPCRMTMRGGVISALDAREPRSARQRARPCGAAIRSAAKPADARSSRGPGQSRLPASTEHLKMSARSQERRSVHGAPFLRYFARSQNSATFISSSSPSSAIVN